MSATLTLDYADWSDRVIVRSDYLGTTDDIEALIRCRKASKLDIRIPNNLPRFPCVTFITHLDVSRIRPQYVQDIGNAIRAMVVLKDIAISYAVIPYEDDAITDAIASHPSIKKVSISSMYSNTVNTMVRENRGIISYSFGSCMGVNYRCGDILAPITWIKRLYSINNIPIFRDGLFAEFVKRNPDIDELRLAVSRVSEVIRALRYLRSINILRIECEVRDDASGLESAIIRVIARCHPICLEIYDGEGWVTQSSVWPNCYVICRRDLPKWNYERSRSVCDVCVHTFDC